MEWVSTTNNDTNHERSDHFNRVSGINNAHSQDRWSQLDARKGNFYDIRLLKLGNGGL